MGRPWLRFVFSVSFLLVRAANAQQQRFDNPAANLSTTWVNNAASLSNIEYSRAFSSGEFFRPILRTSPSGFGERYACGFYKNGSFSGYLFAVLMVYVNSGARITMPTVSPQPVWAANRNRLVGENATLEFTAGGTLVLRDENRAEIWSTSTAGRGVVSMEMLGTGNLVLSDGRRENVWESFSSPTDVLVLGQALRSGMTLTSSVSAANPAEGSYVLEMTGNTLSLSAKGSPPQRYWSASANRAAGDITPYAVYTNGSILFFMTSSSAAAYARSGSANDSDGAFPLQPSTEAQYLQLPPNGNLGVFTKDYSRPETRLASNVFRNDDCGTWPGSCGQYSICNLGQCSCVSGDPPQGTEAAFTQAVQHAPSLGCKPAIPLSGCSSNGSSQAQMDHHFLSMTGIDYLPMGNSANLTVNSSDACQQICSNNCSCRMAIYLDVARACYTFDEVYTLRSAAYIFPDGNLTLAPMALIKVQNASDQRAAPASNSASPPIGTILVAVLLPLLACAVGGISIFLYKRMQQQRRRKEELALDAMVGLPRRFSYKELQQATWSFSRKLGQGGFGTVFLAELPDGEKVAVKRLDNASQGHKDFRTEVSIIGRVRHMNLVELKGFCAENEHRMLICELVANSSLDKWLFPQKDAAASAEGNDHFLSWDARLNIALGVARGLAYLHEGCNEKIIHLDVKAQNILLDADWNAKVCDFGLSRMVKKDESSVFTTMRGTPGYLAPEWLQSSITEKVDVYSYGVVLLELLSGQRSLDTTRLQDGSSRLHFPSWASQRIAQGGSLTDLLDKRLGPEVAKQVDKMTVLFDLALLCIQEEAARRPSMGRVVQVLEDIVVGEVSSVEVSSSVVDDRDSLGLSSGFGSLRADRSQTDDDSRRSESSLDERPILWAPFR